MVVTAPSLACTASRIWPTTLTALALSMSAIRRKLRTSKRISLSVDKEVGEAQPTQVLHVPRAEAGIDEHEATRCLDEQAEGRDAAQVRREEWREAWVHRAAVQIVNLHVPLAFDFRGDGQGDGLRPGRRLA